MVDEAAPGSGPQPLSGNCPSALRGWDRTTATLACLVLAIGAAGGVAAVSRRPSLASPEALLAAPTLAARTAARAAGAPVSVRIPAIGVDAGLVELGIDREGALETPPYEKAGWFAGGPRPGEPGAAVIAAHVDSRTGPAVFFRLRQLRAGDAVSVAYRDGSSVSFRVTRTESFPKAAFPTSQVYGSSPGPELRLITCDGPFDRRSGSYRDNLIVWAVPGPPDDPPPADPQTAAGRLTT